MTSLDRFQSFAVSIANLAGEEARKAKLLYLRNELAEYEASLESSRLFGLLQVLFMVIPFFWPILYLQRRQMINDAQLHQRRIQNALDVWRTDLGDDNAVALESELARMSTRSPGLFPWSKPAPPRQLKA